MISLLLFLKFIQNPCCMAFNTSASLAACQDFQPVTYHSFFKCADSVTACTAPLLWTENVLKLGYELTLSTNVSIFHGARQNAFCQSPSDADFTIYPCSFYSIQFRSCFPSTVFNSSLLHTEYCNSCFIYYFHWLFLCCSFGLFMLWTLCIASAISRLI